MCRPFFVFRKINFNREGREGAWWAYEADPNQHD